jgi:biopolymer transport protein ExbB/TolQ
MSEQTDATKLDLKLDEPNLSWTHDDLEQRLGFRGGRFTACNKLLSFLAAVLLTTLFFVALIYGLKPWPAMKIVVHMFAEHGVIGPIIMVMFFWSLSILFAKWRKLAYQKKALDLAAVPQEPDFVLDRRTASEVLTRVRGLVDDTRHFVLLNRIDRALSNLQNIGDISEVSNILRAQASFDEEQIASSYKLVAGFVWAIPVIGFIGTVLGLSVAIGGFSATLQSSGDLTALKESLQHTTSGLSTAFETTFVALAATLVVQLLTTHLQHEEASFLDECNDYCHAHVVSKLRLKDN